MFKSVAAGFVVALIVQKIFGDDIFLFCTVAGAVTGFTLPDGDLFYGRLYCVSVFAVVGAVVAFIVQKVFGDNTFLFCTASGAYIGWVFLERCGGKFEYGIKSAIFGVILGCVIAYIVDTIFGGGEHYALFGVIGAILCVVIGLLDSGSGGGNDLRGGGEPGYIINDP